MGVEVHGKRFQARIRVNGKRVYLGTFDTRPEAVRAIKQAAGRQHQHVISPENKPLTVMQRVKNAFSLKRSNASTKEQ